ncbi:hypothetical protein FJZ28_04335 [Candidatus Peregrinibacteria bacterium]|nr:hypothetical protein [Candidatus Peregrinibacteria bacterium]
MKIRPATTLIELLLFLGFFAGSSGVLVAFFFATTGQRLQQQNISSVEQSGLQILQSLAMRIRTAERVLDPVMGQTGAILALQVADQTMHPTVVGLESGALIVGQAETRQVVSSSQVLVEDFVVTNTSVTPSRASVRIRFTVSKPIPTSLTLRYTREFETVISLYPDDVESGNPCSCSSPSCNGGRYRYEYCPSETCVQSPVTLPCG